MEGMMNCLKTMEMNKSELLRIWRRFRPPVMWLYMFILFVIVCLTHYIFFK